MKLKPLSPGFVTLFEMLIAAVVGFLLRDLVELIVVLFSIKISSTWIALVLAIPLVFLAVKAHYAFRRWLTENGWLKSN